MKCDELKSYNVVATVDVNPEVVDSLGCTEWTGYDKNEVDAAIAELKTKLEDVQATAYAESVDAGMENRRLKRALWLTRGAVHKAKRLAMYELLKVHPLWEGRPAGLKVHKNIDRYERYERKCLKKAEEYK